MNPFLSNTRLSNHKWGRTYSVLAFKHIWYAFNKKVISRRKTKTVSYKIWFKVFRSKANGSNQFTLFLTASSFFRWHFSSWCESLSRSWIQRSISVSKLAMVCFLITSDVICEAKAPVSPNHTCSQCKLQLMFWESRKKKWKCCAWLICYKT